MTSRAIPEPIFNYLADMQIHRLFPAWAKLDMDCKYAVESGGHWSRYVDGESLKHDVEIENTLFFLCGQSFARGFLLPQMELKPARFTDVHHLRIEGESWLLLLDVTHEISQQKQQQQNANELSLLKDRQQRVLNRVMGNEIANMSVEGKLTFDAAGEFRDVSTLFVDLRSFTTFNSAFDPQYVIDVLNQYLHAMLPPIMAECGLVDKILGDGAMAVFGVIPSGLQTAENAIRAAFRIQKQITELNNKRRADGVYVMQAGIGIASGEAVLGIIGSRERRDFSAIGPHVNLAARLEAKAEGGEILVDENTFQTIEHLLSGHKKMQMELKGIGMTSVYSVRG